MGQTQFINKIKISIAQIKIQPTPKRDCGWFIRNACVWTAIPEYEVINKS